MTNNRRRRNRRRINSDTSFIYFSLLLFRELREYFKSKETYFQAIKPTYEQIEMFGL